MVRTDSMKEDINFTDNEIEFLKHSRDSWMAKYQKTKPCLKRLKNRIRYLEKSKANWKNIAKELKAELAKTQAELDAKNKELETELKKQEHATQLATSPCEPPAFYCFPASHNYSIGQIMLFLSLVLSATTSFRGASRAMELVYTSLNLSFKAPSWFTGRLWVLRLGYYKLTRSKQVANDWVWIIDHTVQLGTEKCLLIVGLRLATLPAVGNCLTHQDIEPIALLPVKRSNGAIVLQQLSECVSITGIPRQIVGDHGPDLKSGIRQFCTEHPETSFIYDIKHKTAALLKQFLKNDPTWATFRQLASQSKCQVQQTSLAALAPPNQRSKARYMNVDLLINWGRKMLYFFDEQIDSQTLFDSKQVIAKLGWILAFRESLGQWHVVLQLVMTTESFVRTEGISRDCEIELSNLLSKLVINERTSLLRTQLIKFVRKEASKCQPNERLVGSSEVIESIFGKLKYLERDQAGNGFTALVLCLAAMLSNTTNETVKTALESVSAQQVRLWQKKHLGKSVQAQRKEALINPDKALRKKEENSVIIENNNEIIFHKNNNSCASLIKVTVENNNKIVVDKS